jgi:hypothetical protein
MLRPADRSWVIERAMGIDARGDILATGLLNGVEHVIVLEPVGGH